MLLNGTLGAEVVRDVKPGRELTETFSDVSGGDETWTLRSPRGVPERDGFEDRVRFDLVREGSCLSSMTAGRSTLPCVTVRSMLFPAKSLTRSFGVDRLRVPCS